MFKVVPDQLRISDGWVRCGQCEEIFDASAHMQDDVVPVASVPEAPATAPHAPVAAELTEPAPGELAVPSRPADIDFELKEPEAGPVLEPALASGDLLPDGSAYGRTEPVLPEPEDTPSAAPPASEPTLSFMRGAGKPSRWHHPLVRASLMVLSLLLVAGLVLQLLVHERDRIAAVEPGLRPVLEEVCLLMQCKVAPLRQIESVVIDSSAFSKVKGDVYRLSLTLKNNAPIDLAMPAIELALTDTLDHPLMRRVFPPAELGDKSGVIPAASETQATLVLTIKANGNGERVAGYRLLAFYP